MEKYGNIIQKYEFQNIGITNHSSLKIFFVTIVNFYNHFENLITKYCNQFFKIYKNLYIFYSNAQIFFTSTLIKNTFLINQNKLYD